MSAPRRRDAAATRTALLDAASTLFDERGYERTTVRELAERAGVDAALIPRYFGSKAGLYLAALQAEPAAGPTDLLDADRLAELLARTRRRGPGPVLAAAAGTHDDPSVQDAAAAALQARVVMPLLRRFTDAGMADAQLRAELATAAFAGIVRGRSAAALPALSAVEDRQLLPLVAALLRGVAE